MMKRTFFFLFVCLLSLSSIGQTHAALTIKDKDKAKAEIIFRYLAYKRDTVACKQVEAWAATSLIPLAQKYKILCDALKGDKAAARFGKNLLETSGHSDKLFFGWFDTIIEGKLGFSHTLLEHSSRLIGDGTREDAALYLILTDRAGVMPTFDLLLKLHDWNTKAQLQFRFVSKQRLNAVKTFIEGNQAIAEMDSNILCEKATYLNGQKRTWLTQSRMFLEAKRRGLSCDVNVAGHNQVAVEPAKIDWANLHKFRSLDLKKAPAISETIDWAKSLVLLHAKDLDGSLVLDTLNVLLKYEEDIKIAEAQLPKLMATTTA